jgi:hypothetical protein
LPPEQEVARSSRAGPTPEHIPPLADPCWWGFPFLPCPLAGNVPGNKAKGAEPIFQRLDVLLEAVLYDLRSMPDQAQILAASTRVLAAQTRGDEVRCDYSKRTACTDAGCKVFPAGSAFLLIPSLERLNTFDPEVDWVPEIRRCDNKGCTLWRYSHRLAALFLI